MERVGRGKPSLGHERRASSRVGERGERARGGFEEREQAGRFEDSAGGFEEEKWGSALAQAARASMQLLAMPSRVPRRREASSRPAPMPPPRRVLHYREVPPFISNSACPAKARRRMHRAKPRCPKLPKLLPRLMKHNPKLDPPPSRFCAPHACLSTPAATPVPAAAPAYAEGRDHQMPTSGGPGEPTPPVPGVRSAPVRNRG